MFNQFTNFSTSRFGQFFWIGLSTLVSILVAIVSLFRTKDYEKYITRLK